MVQMPWTMGLSIHDNPYHLPIIRSQLTRNVGVVFSDIRDEIVAAWGDALPLKGDGMSVKHDLSLYELRMSLV
jgi:hypothetical protein